MTITKETIERELPAMSLPDLKKLSTAIHVAVLEAERRERLGQSDLMSIRINDDGMFISAAAAGEATR